MDVLAPVPVLVDVPVLVVPLLVEPWAPVLVLVLVEPCVPLLVLVEPCVPVLVLPVLVEPVLVLPVLVELPVLALPVLPLLPLPEPEQAAVAAMERPPATRMLKSELVFTVGGVCRTARGPSRKALEKGLSRAASPPCREWAGVRRRRASEPRRERRQTSAHSLA